MSRPSGIYLTLQNYKFHKKSLWLDINFWTKVSKFIQGVTVVRFAKTTSIRYSCCTSIRYTRSFFGKIIFIILRNFSIQDYINVSTLFSTWTKGGKDGVNALPVSIFVKSARDLFENARLIENERSKPEAPSSPLKPLNNLSLSAASKFMPWKFIRRKHALVQCYPYKLIKFN